MRPYVKELERLIMVDDIENPLSAIDSILGNKNEPDETGIELQRIYDQN